MYQKEALKLKQRGDRDIQLPLEKSVSAASPGAGDQAYSVDFLPSMDKIPGSIPRSTSLTGWHGPSSQEVQAEEAGVQVILDYRATLEPP